MSIIFAMGALALAQNSASIVHRFMGPMPTGVTVSKSGRIFVTFPRWGDPVPSTLCEIRGGKEVPYPNAEVNRLVKSQGADQLINVQSAVIDEKDRLWAVDTGSVNMGYAIPNSPKLVCIDLNTDQITKKIHFPSNVVPPTSYLNDVRFDLSNGSEGYAFITDSSDKGSNGIVVVDLASGKSWRRLNNHPSTLADPAYTPMAEGRPLLIRPPQGPEVKPKIGADGIAIDVSADRLYYCPLVSDKLYSVSVKALENPDTSDDAVGQTVQMVTSKPGSDGLFNDGNGRVLLTDYEHHQVQRLRRDGKLEPFLRIDPRYWPDTLSVTPSGDIYLVANQLHRMPKYNRGKDLRAKPYLLIKMKVPE
jgi:sugar lactone lactonase YvrE